MDKPGEFNSIKLSKGVYAALVTISEIKDLSNYPGQTTPPNLRNDGTPYQLCIEVKYEREDGQDWSTRFYGDYLEDTVTGKIQKWKTFANGIYEFFKTMYGSHEEVENRVNDDWSIGELLTKPLIGRKFYRVSYISGLKDDSKGKYKDFNRIFLEDATIEQMQDVWSTVAPKMKTYTPEAVDEIEKMRDEQATSFPHGANVEATESEMLNKDDEEFEL